MNLVAKRKQKAEVCNCNYSGCGEAFSALNGHIKWT